MVPLLFKKMLPSQILSNLAMTLCSQINIILIGRFIGVNGVTAYGLINPMLLLLIAVTGLVSVGISTVCSHHVGRGDKTSIKKNYATSVVTSIVIGVFVALGIFFGVDSVASFLGATPGTVVFDTTKNYIRGYIVGFPAYFLMTTLTPYLQIAGKRRIVVVSIATLTSFNVILGMLCGFFFRGNMLYMGLVTSVAEIAACIIVVTYFVRPSCMFKFSFKNISPRQFAKTAVAGSPIAVNQVCYTVAAYAMNMLLLKHGGDNAVAAFSVLGSLIAFCFTANSGIGATVQLLTGIFFGEEDKNSVYNTLRQGFVWVLLLNAIIATVVFIFARPFASLYITDNPEVLNMTVEAIRIDIYSIIPVGIAVLFKNYYPCIKKLPLAILLGVFENMIFSVTSYTVMSSFFGVKGLWAGDLCAEIAAVLLIVLITVVHNKKLGLKTRNFSLIEIDFSLPEDHTIGFNISNLEELDSAVSDTETFCLWATGDEHFAETISLGVRRISEDIINNSFIDGNDNIIQIRIINKESYWIMRVRDNCSTYNPTAYMTLRKHKTSPTDRNIRAFFKLMTDANYVNSLGFNCVTVKLALTEEAAKEVSL